MKKARLTLVTFFVSILLVTSVIAQDPSKHQVKKEKPKCEAMEEMDHSKMDPNNPVMLALMKKCMHSGTDANKHSEMTHRKSSTHNGSGHEH